MQEVEGALHVHVNDGVPLLLAHAHDQTVFGDTGVVYQDINAAKLFLNLGHYRLGLLKIGGVGGIGLHFVAEGGNLGNRLLGGFVDNQVRKGYIGPFRGKLKGNGLTDSAGCARNERYFSV